ncbi:MAG TPA: hypothetical protein P5049_01605 [Methanothrix sp.]|nr:hypothetical protein [Methanothrix sp.]
MDGRMNDLMSGRTLRADETLKVGEFALIPVAEVHSFSMVRGETATFAGTKRANAVVAVGPGGAVALDVGGEEVSLDELLAEVPGLKELVARALRSEEEGRG